MYKYYVKNKSCSTLAPSLMFSLVLLLLCNVLTTTVMLLKASQDLIVLICYTMHLPELRNTKSNW